MFFPLTRLYFCLVLSIAASFTIRADQAAVWTTGSGLATFTPLTGLLTQLGIELHDETNGPFAPSFKLTDESTIKFVTPWGSPDSFLGGSLRCSNGISIKIAGIEETNTIMVAPLEFFALKDTDLFELRDDDGEPVMTIEHFDTRFEPGLHSLSLHRAVVRIAAPFADRIHRPELAGMCVATLECEIEVHELEARIDRRKRPPPFACGLPIDPAAVVKLRSVEAVQQISEIENGVVPVGVSMTVENPGPTVAPSTSLRDIPLSVAVLAVKEGVTSNVLRVESRVRFDPSSRNPCPDETKFIPGSIARRSLADVVAEKTWLAIPSEQLEAAARGEQTLTIEATSGGTPIIRSVRPIKRGAAWLFNLPAR